MKKTMVLILGLVMLVGIALPISLACFSDAECPGQNTQWITDTTNTVKQNRYGCSAEKCIITASRTVECNEMRPCTNGICKDGICIIPQPGDDTISGDGCSSTCQNEQTSLQCTGSDIKLWFLAGIGLGLFIGTIVGLTIMGIIQTKKFK